MKIVVCGSMLFAKTMVNVKKKLEEKGHKVIVPWGVEDFLEGSAWLKEREAKNWEPMEGAKRKMKHNLIKGYYDEIKESDAILVINEEKNSIQNYIGGNTFLEMGFAHVLGKKIFCLNPLPEELKIFYQELIAMQPVILNGDMNRIEGIETKQGCDNKSVGILVWQNDKLLLIERKKFPFGFAPPSGHVDEHGSFEQAARNELKEEVGLDAIDLKLIKEGRKDNPCRRGSTWHYWKIYQAETEGELKPSQEETKQAGWYSKDELKRLANRTEDYLAGTIKEDEWQSQPGLEPVWYDWLKEIKVV